MLKQDKTYKIQPSKDEAIQKIEVFQKNKATKSATAVVASILKTEGSLDPTQIRNLIGDCITFAAVKNKRKKTG